MCHKFTFFIGLITSVVFGASQATPILAEGSTNDTQDSIEQIECTGNEYRSYCSNEYRCTTDDAGNETCEYVAVISAELSDDSVASPESAPEESEEPEDPEMWPAYLSLGAIGATFVLILIINLSARKYNKK